MKTINKKFYILTLLCSLLIMSSCSDFPDEMVVNGNVTVDGGNITYNPDSKTYNKELIINVNIDDSSEPLTEAFVTINNNTTIDFLKQLNRNKGGKATVILNNLSFSRSHSPVVTVRSKHFCKSIGHNFYHNEGSFCKISNFKIISYNDASKGADVFFHIDESPATSDASIVLKKIGGSDVVISPKSSPGDYTYNLKTETLNATYTCSLNIMGIQISDTVRYTTPGPLTTLSVKYELVSKNNYKNGYHYDINQLSVTVRNFEQIQGEKRIEFWSKKENSSSSYKLCAKNVMSSETASYRYYYVTNETSWNSKYLYLMKFYVDDNLCATAEGSYTSYPYNL